jgi:hypothetical protein
MEPTSSTDGEVTAPPYISFRTILNLVERMADEGLPPRIDRSYLSKLSGGYQGQVLAALRWLNLVDDEGRVQESLIGLVQNPSEHGERIGVIIRERYPEAVSLGQQNATQGQLEEEFRKSGIGGATLRKATSFYLHAAAFGGIPVSPYFKASAPQAGRRTPQRRKPRAKQEQITPTVNPPPPNGPTLDSLRTRYVEMLMEKAEGQDEMDDNLLNRIEALLGYGGEANGKREVSEDLHSAH